VIPLLVAIPVGVAVGRWAWLEYARDLDVVPHSVTPLAALALIVLATSVISNFVVLAPGRAVTKRRPGRDLRAE
jgi:hypothetical protein